MKLASRTIGSGGIPALFLHGMLAHSGMWRGVGAELADVVSGPALDWPQHGKSPDWPGGDLHGTCTAAAAEMIDRPALVIGHSFGGTVALRLAIEHPEKVAGLVMIDPVLIFLAVAANRPESSREMEDYPAWKKMIAAGQRAKAAAEFMRVWGSGSDWAAIPEAQQSYIADRIHMVAEPEDVVYHDAPGLRDRMADIACPSLLITGADSPEIMAAIAEEARALRPGLQHVAVPGAGHMVPVTHPAEVALPVRRLAQAMGDEPFGPARVQVNASDR